VSKTFLVTGASRGLGRQIALAVLDAGHHLIAGARKPGDLDAIAGTYGDQIRAVALDVTDADAAQAAVQAALDSFGRLDVVVNNAGYANLASVEDVTLEDFRAQIETNLFGVVNVTKAALPVLRRQGHGHVVQVSSVGARLATAGLSAYQSAKWAVSGFSSVLAQEVAPLGIKVTVLEPGGMRTDWAGSSMSVPPVSQPYQPTVGAMATMHDGKATNASDPAKVAQVVLRVADMAEPPLRLLLGSDAYTYATAAGRSLLDEDERWRGLSTSTDDDTATAADMDPLGQRSASGAQ
jgi:NAD(P)-dependent dehydrogenase (short-subunit alcohol dehydrogenase family)